MGQIWVVAVGLWRRARRGIQSSARSTRFALTLCLFGMLLSACGGNSAVHTPPIPTTGTVTLPSPVARPTASPGARGAGVNVEPSYRPWRYLDGPAPESWWCVPPNCIPDESPRTRIDVDLSLANELGVNMVRVEFPWRFIESGRGVYDWTRADLIVSEAARYHVELQPIVVYSPAWVGAPTSAPSPDDFRAFMAALVGRYHATIHYWEMWNEPDLSKYWNASEQAYVEDILVPGYLGVKAADPTALVVMGGPSWASGDWVNHLYDYGGGDSFDIAAWHAYGSVSDVLASAQDMRQLLANQHQANKPLWLGEYGVQDSSTSDDAQTSLLTGVLTSHSPIAQADWYTLRDEDSMTCCPPAVAVSASWGLVERDATRRKAGFDALRRLISAGLPAVETSQG